MRLKGLAVVVLILSFVTSFIPASVSAQTLALNPASGTVGSEVVIPSSCGYGTGDYYIYWEDTQKVIQQGTVVGCPSLYFTVPEGSRGKHTVILKISGKTYEAEFTVLPSISLGALEGNVGSSITVTGRGFSANESGIQVIFDGNSLKTGITADRNGYWQSTVKIPESNSGSHTIDAAGVTAADDIEDQFFKITPKIILDSSAGPVGSAVNVTGSGFDSSETDIKIYYDDLLVKTEITASNSGSWQSSFFIPPSTRGVHTITAYGSVSGQDSSTGAIFNVSPVVKLEPKSGIVGSLVSPDDTILVSGIGFIENESGIQVLFDGTMLSSNIIADAKGSWAVQVKIPPAFQGTHNITASGSMTAESEVAAASLMISPIMEINPVTGNIGQEVAINGSGFNANKNVIVSFDGRPIGPPVSTDNKGTFSTSIKIPAGTRYGEHIIMCSDSSAVSSATFSVESTAPSTPVPVSPEAGAKMGELGNTIIDFRWEPVQDPSGITYVLELSRGTDFAGVVLRKDGLSANEYTLSDSEALTNGEYYWRVKAIDGALNESDWSAAQSLQINAFEIPVLAIIIVAIVLFVGLIIWRIVSITRRGGWKT